MSRRNRQRKRLFKLKLTARQIGHKLTGPTLVAAIKSKTSAKEKR